LLITEPLPESLPLSQWGLETENGKLRVTTVAHVLAEAIRRIHNEESVSSLFV